MNATRRKNAPLAGGTRHPRADTFGTAAGRWTNTFTGQGLTDDRHAFTGFLTPGRLDSQTIDALIRYEPIARRIVFREPDDAMREGYTVTVDGQPAPELDAATQVEADRLNLNGAISNAARWARAYGGAGIVVFTDDGLDPVEPLDRSRASRVLSLLVLDRTQLQVLAWNSRIDSVRFNTPEIYTVSTTQGARISQVHASRVIRFVGETLPMREMIRNDGWGGSTLDLVWAALRNYATTNEYATEAITLLTQGVWTFPDLAKAYSSGNVDAVLQRVEAIRHGMGMLGDLILDEGEGYSIATRSLSGLRDAMEGIKDQLVASSDMPRSLLFGESPGGLNSGENAGEIRSWYDHVASRQRTYYQPRLQQLLDLIWGARKPEGAGIEWAPLWQPTEQEVAQTELTRAQRRSLDVSSTVITAAEAREDPSVAEVYGIDPGAISPAPAAPAAVAPNVPGPGEEVEGEDAAPVIVAADPRLAPEGEPLISAKEAALRLGVGPGSIQGMASRGEIQAYRVGRLWRFAWSQIQQATAAR